MQHPAVLLLTSLSRSHHHHLADGCMSFNKNAFACHFLKKSIQYTTRSGLCSFFFRFVCLLLGCNVRVSSFSHTFSLIRVIFVYSNREKLESSYLVIIVYTIWGYLQFCAFYLLLVYSFYCGYNSSCDDALSRCCWPKILYSCESAPARGVQEICWRCKYSTSNWF